TQLRMWEYGEPQNLDPPSIYYAHTREVFRRDGMLIAVGPYTPPIEGSEEEPFTATVRYRTVGDMTCTSPVESSAKTPLEVIEETAVSRISERGATRNDDKFSEAAMEDRKREGY